MAKKHTIEIRGARSEDGEALARLFADRNAYSQTLQLPFPGVDLWRKRLADQGDAHHALVAIVGSELVGNIGVHRLTRARRAHVAEIGMGVRDSWQGKGVGSALMRAALDLADNWLGLKRIELTVYIDNKRAIALYRKFGFEVEGTHRGYSLRDGAYVDAHTMARIVPGPQITVPKTPRRS
jgi:L-phenylalanine/L-methionine N-acetyltransferase